MSKKSAYLNPDGTFKNGFDGCVLHMTRAEGHSEESAKKICGYINAHKNRSLSVPILNREGKVAEDGWFHAVPMGVFWNEDAGVHQLIDDKAVDAMVNNFRPKVLVDQEHFSYDTSKSSEAFAWADQVQKRDDGLWAHFDLTDIGSTAIKNSRYRFISPVWLRDDTERVSANVIRPLRVDTWGLTNSPNMKGMVPLTNRAGATPDANQPTTGESVMKDRLIAILGASADATDTSLVEMVQALKNRGAIVIDVRKELGDVDEGQIVNRVKTLVADNKSLLETQVESDLKEFEGVIANRDEMKKQLLANRAGTVALLRSLKAPAKPALHNRKNAATPSSSELASNDALRTEKIKNRCAAIQLDAKRSGKSVSHHTAWSQATHEVDAENPAKKE